MTDIRLRPVTRDDLSMLCRFAVEPELNGFDWRGYGDAQRPERRFDNDGFLGPDDGTLIVEHQQVAIGFVNWRAGAYHHVPRYWEIGIALLPESRGRGIGWRAQAMLCDYLFTHTAVQRIEAGTQPENKAEQRALEKAGFSLEGVIRSFEFRAGQWRDLYLYSRIRTDPAPQL